MSALAFLLSLFFASTASANTDGTHGAVGQIQIWSDTSQTGDMNAGFVQIGSEYLYWGPSLCPGITPPTDAQIALLFQARIEGISVNPWYQTPYSKEYPCLTTFRLY